MAQPASTLTPEQARLEEEALANELIADQEIYAAEQDLATLAAQGQQFGKPSLLKYFFLGSVAIVQDLVDVLDVSGIGAIVAFGVSLICGAIIIVTCYVTNTRYKKAQQYNDEVFQLFPLIQERINYALRLTARAARYGRKIKSLRPVVRRGLRVINRAKRWVKRNPLTKVIFLNVLDFIPFIGIVPFSTISIMLAYRDERAAFQKARELSQSIFLNE